MTSINSVNENNVLSDLAINKKSAEKPESDKDMFMRLMLAQLENQNPLDPKDGAEFVSQLAQFSTLEGIGNINNSVQEIGGLYRSSQALQATALVGRDVLLPSNEAFFDQQTPVSGIIGAPGQTALDAKLTITDAAGQVVRTENLGNLQGDIETPFTWDGTDDSGNPLPPGKYSVAVSGRIADEVEALDVNIHARVSSVSIVNSQGDMMLNLHGLGQMSAADIKQLK